MMEVLRGNLVLHQNGSVLSDGNHGLLMQTFFVLRGSIIRNDRDGRYIQTLCTGNRRFGTELVTSSSRTRKASRSTASNLT